MDVNPLPLSRDGRLLVRCPACAVAYTGLGQPTAEMRIARLEADVKRLREAMFAAALPPLDDTGIAGIVLSPERVRAHNDALKAALEG